MTTLTTHEERVRALIPRIDRLYAIKAFDDEDRCWLLISIGGLLVAEDTRQNENALDMIEVCIAALETRCDPEFGR